MKVLRYIWTSPTTVFGLVFLVPTLIRGKAKVVDGVLELHGPFVAFFLSRGTLLRVGASAMTLGHVVIGRDQLCLDQTRDHERVHVRQAERWGPLFLPAYLISSVIVWCRGGNAYRDNPFEREAYGRTSARRAGV